MLARSHSAGGRERESVCLCMAVWGGGKKHLNGYCTFPLCQHAETSPFLPADIAAATEEISQKKYNRSFQLANFH